MSVSSQKTPHAQRVSLSVALKVWGFLAAVVGAVILADQATKAYVVRHLEPYRSWMPIEELAPLFRFTHVRNTGAAFGLFPQGGMFFVIVALIVTLVILYYYRQIEMQSWWVRLALGLQLGGALGNVVDRLRQGYVVDFFDVGFWPVFNVADSCIVIGVVIFALVLLREEYRSDRQDQSAPSPAPDDEPASPPERQVISG